MCRIILLFHLTTWQRQQNYTVCSTQWRRHQCRTRCPRVEHASYTTSRTQTRRTTGVLMDTAGARTAARRWSMPETQWRRFSFRYSYTISHLSSSSFHIGLLSQFIREYKNLGLCRTSNMEIIKSSQSAFNFVLPSVQIAKRRDKFGKNLTPSQCCNCRLLCVSDR